MGGCRRTVKMPVTYCFNEFEAHIAAMKEVYNWEHLSLGGKTTYVGKDQSHWAMSGRIIEYFRDSYPDISEAMNKSEVFMRIHDYIGENFARFRRQGFIKETGEERRALVSLDLYRAVHHVFADYPYESREKIKPRQVLALAKAFRAVRKAA